MDVKDLNRIGKGFNDILRLKTTPLGIILYEKESDITRDFQILDRKMVTCAVLGLSRYYEIPVAITKKYTKGICLGPDISLGWGEVPPNFGKMAAGMFADSEEEADKVLAGMMSLERGKYEAYAVAPIDKMSVIPDIVQIWGNPLQMMELVYANTWYNGGERISLSTNGHGGSCYEVLTVPFIKGVITLALADMGDRRHGYAGDDDMIMGVPISKLETLYNGLVQTQNTLNKVPILYNFDDLPFPIPNSVLKRKLKELD